MQRHNVAEIVSMQNKEFEIIKIAENRKIGYSGITRTSFFCFE